MKCANFQCDNDLTEWELKRRKFKFSSSDFCRKCRFRGNYININNIRCRGCGESFQQSQFKVFCNSCYKARRRESSRLRQITYRNNQKQKGLKSIYNRTHYIKKKQINKAITNTIQ